MPIFRVKSVKKNATFSRKICKNLHRAIFFTQTPSVVSVTNKRYACGPKFVPKVIPTLHQNCPNVVSKLFQVCLKDVQESSQSEIRIKTTRLLMMMTITTVMLMMMPPAQRTRQGAISERAGAYTRTLSLIYNALGHHDINT